MSSISSIFYTEECYLMRETVSLPNKYGQVKTSYELIYPNPIPCAIGEISNAYSQNKYGIGVVATTEVSFDIDADFNCREVKVILINDIEYEVVDYRVYEPFMILSRSIRYAIRRRG